MNINLMPKYIAMNVLLALLVAGISLAAIEPQANPSIVIELNDSTLNNSLTLYPFFILEFYKPVCDPCGRMNAAVFELSSELAGQAAFGRIDGEKNNVTAERYNVTTYPTLLVFDNGTTIERSRGFASKRYTVDILGRVKKDLNTSLVSY